MTRVPTEQSTQAVKAYLAESILKAAAQGHTNYDAGRILLFRLQQRSLRVEYREKLRHAVGIAGAGTRHPSVQLNGTVGFDALDIRNVWKGSSLQYMVGPSVSLPIFAGGKLKSTLELRDAQQQEAAITYHKTVLQAWHDVVNALVALSP